MKTHEFSTTDLICRCSECGWTFELPPNEHQQIVIRRVRREKFECPLTEEIKQEYGFVTTERR